MLATLRVASAVPTTRSPGWNVVSLIRYERIRGAFFCVAVAGGEATTPVRTGGAELADAVGRRAVGAGIVGALAVGIGAGVGAGGEAGVGGGGDTFDLVPAACTVRRRGVGVAACGRGDGVTRAGCAARCAEQAASATMASAKKSREFGTVSRSFAIPSPCSHLQASACTSAKERACF
ncbi:MAG TPA: hypothetical protein VMV73_03445 [Candidatus Dormibacteraeota bacterium]|nr:hypothetical protein [Candidatus Dormibacteraeota bacterium]